MRRRRRKKTTLTFLFLGEKREFLSSAAGLMVFVNYSLRTRRIKGIIESKS